MSLLDEAQLGTASCTNEWGKEIYMVSSVPRDGTISAVVVIPPGYERRILHYSVISRTLTDNGFATLRFDLTNHVGLSDGEIADLTMTSIAGDIAAVLDYAREHNRDLPILVLAPSLAARAAARSLTRVDDASGCVMLLPVADVAYSIAQAAGADVCGIWRRGEARDPQRLYRVVEHDVRLAFGKDAVEAGWGGVDAASQDIARVDAPIAAISAQEDDWVRVADVEAALTSGQTDWPRSLTVIEATSHDIARNPPVMRLLLETAMTYLHSMISTSSSDNGSNTWRIPDFERILETITVERRWARDEYAAL